MGKYTVSGLGKDAVLDSGQFVVDIVEAAKAAGIPEEEAARDAWDAGALLDAGSNAMLSHIMAQVGDVNLNAILQVMYLVGRLRERSPDVVVGMFDSAAEYRRMYNAVTDLSEPASG